MGDAARYMKRKVVAGDIEADPNQMCLIVNYVVEAQIFDDEGNPMQVEQQENQKRIRLTSLNEHTNIRYLAQDIINKCKLIPESKRPVVENLLLMLQRAIGDQEPEPEDDMEMLRNMHNQREMRVDDSNRMEYDQAAERAVMDDLDTYIEWLYDAMEDKIKGTYMILQLARNPLNLDGMSQDETLLGVLSRLLKEDGRKSMDLLINIIYIFYSFSNFSQFHGVITKYGVGDLIMKTIDLEIKRHNLRQAENEQKAQEAGENEDLLREVENDDRKFRLMAKKQEKLLYVCFHVLLNLAEDLSVEKKMKKRNVVQYLVAMLDRRNTELLILVITFLKKLSIFKENKDEMAQTNIVEKLGQFIPCKNEVLLNAALRLLLNLSFDIILRDIMVKTGLIPKLVDLLKVPHFRSVTLRLLYHMSIEDKCKSMFTYTDCIPLIKQLIVNYPENYVAKELVALAVNLTANSRNAEKMCEQDGLHLLMDRSFRTRDALLMKVIRNLSQHDGASKTLFTDYIVDLVLLAKETEESDLLVEVLGTLGNLTLPEYDFARLIEEYDLLEFFAKHLTPGYSDDDIVLEVVIFIGTLATDPECGPLVAHSNLVHSIYELIAEKQEDDEIVLQACYTFYKLLGSVETRQLILHNHLVSYLIDLLNDKNQEIRKVADMALDLIMDIDEGWREKIVARKFQLHNAEWINVMNEDDAMMEAEGYMNHNDGMMQQSGEYGYENQDQMEYYDQRYEEQYDDNQYDDGY
eukprot:GFYU01002664.1.p1 GENE.GFYU01002664.1~~GFYU01002664.1.p1  ORF type:complete len:747 (-),score=301.65 GFYU01002664.1:27-2267(-)